MDLNQENIEALALGLSKVLSDRANKMEETWCWYNMSETQVKQERKRIKRMRQLADILREAFY